MELSLVTESLKIRRCSRAARSGSRCRRPAAMRCCSAQVGTSTATTTTPLAEHLTTVTLDPNNVDPSIWRLIQNGFSPT